ncbi:MAG: sigma-70 family RNA polymerase sigma factor [Hyphomonas sp.]|nr:sigma-70 family RNA polymerase sigma factor [Hyphomonas sp.]
MPDTFGADLAREMTELRGYALWLCNSGSLADDLIQDTLLRAWAARDRFQPGTNLKAWCTTILRNVFFSYKRRSWRSQPLPDDVVDELASESANSGHRLDLLALRNAIALLPEDQREALLLVGAGGQSYIEAAKVCACAVGTVKSRVSRARLRLAALMSENRAGFNSDSSLEADGALDDLMDQVSRLKGKVGGVRTRDKASMYAPAVLSEPA